MFTGLKPVPLIASLLFELNKHSRCQRNNRAIECIDQLRSTSIFDDQPIDFMETDHTKDDEARPKSKNPTWRQFWLQLGSKRCLW